MNNIFHIINENCLEEKPRKTHYNQVETNATIGAWKCSFEEFMTDQPTDQQQRKTEMRGHREIIAIIAKKYMSIQSITINFSWLAFAKKITIIHQESAYVG